MSTNRNLQFRRYLKAISDKLMAKDIRRLCFLLQDILNAQSLEKIKRGLHLFSELEKMMLLTQDDVSLVVELMELIKRKDLVKYAMEEWEAASRGPKNQPQISKYRQLLLTVALEMTSEDFVGVKHLAMGFITTNIDETQDMMELLSVMEKLCLISTEKVDVLQDILPNKLIEKVRVYKGDVLGHREHSRSNSSSHNPGTNPGTVLGHREHSTSSSSSHNPGTNQPALPQQVDPNLVGTPGAYGPLPYHPNHPYPYQSAALHYMHGYTYPHFQPVEGYQAGDHWGTAYHFGAHLPPRNANFMHGYPHGRPPGNVADHQAYQMRPPVNSNSPDNPQQMPLHPARTPVEYSHCQLQQAGYRTHPTRLPIHTNSAGNIQQTPPHSDRIPTQNTSPPGLQPEGLSPNCTSSNKPPSYMPDTGLDDTSKLPKDTILPPQHCVQPQSAMFGSSLGSLTQGSLPQLGQEVKRSIESGGEGDGQQAQDVGGFEQNFASLRVHQSEASLSSVINQGEADQPGPVSATNTSGTERTGQEHDTITCTATLVPPPTLTSSNNVSTDTFPKDLSERINSLCSNNSDLQLLSTQGATNTEDGHQLNFDGPLHLPSVAHISPNDLKIPDPKVIPCYQLTHDPRGMAIIINNVNFVKKEPHNFEFRAGAYKDAGSLVQLFRSLKFTVLCKNDLAMQEMHDILDEVRRYDHGQYDCFVCCILTHGQMGEVYGSDSLPIRIEELLGLFNGVKCKSLIGKPKLFFIQACQGNVKQPGRPVQMDNPPNDAQGTIDTIPIVNDFLIGYSTLPGYASYRSTEDGSWYVIALVLHIRELHGEVDMANMLALVNGYMSKCSDKDGFKQSSPHRSTLTKPLYL